MADKKTYKLEDLIIDACDTLDCDWDNIQAGLYDVDDMVHEIADQTVPIYYYDIALYAANNFHLIQDIPDCGRECEPYKMIQMNIYEAICEGLYEHIAEIEEREAEADQMEMDSESNGYNKKDKEKEDDK